MMGVAPIKCAAQLDPWGGSHTSYIPMHTAWTKPLPILGGHIVRLTVGSLTPDLLLLLALAYFLPLWVRMNKTKQNRQHKASITYKSLGE